MMIDVRIVDGTRYIIDTFAMRWAQVTEDGRPFSTGSCLERTDPVTVGRPLTIVNEKPHQVIKTKAVLRADIFMDTFYSLNIN